MRAVPMFFLDGLSENYGAAGLNHRPYLRGPALN